MNSNSIIGIIVILVILVGGYFLIAGDRNQDQTLTPTSTTPRQTTSTPSPPNNESGTATSGDQARTVTVLYTAQGFTPATVTISKGDTITWKNESTSTMWVASDAHPTHALYDGTSRDAHCPNTSNKAFDQCENGSIYSFTFDKTGAWKYHNHVLSNFTGTITVTP